MNDGKLCCSNAEADIEIINYSTDFSDRIHGIIDESVLQDRIITVFGLGSGGASVAMYLVRSGVTKLNLVDFDTVSISNLCRSAYDLFDVGRKKTEALYEKLLRINPCVEIHLYDEDLTKMELAKLISLIDSSDLIIEATDSIKSKMLINGLSYEKIPVIYPSVYDMGKGGDILFTFPGVTPCFECIFLGIIKEMLKLKKGDWDYSTGQAKPMASLITDIQVVVARAVKLALAILTADTENSFLEKITESGCTLLLIGNEKDFGVFDMPFQEVWAETEINPECSCRTLS